MPSRFCVACNTRKYKDAFLLSQFNRKDRRSHCNDCVEHYKDVGTPLECNACDLWKSLSAFDESQRHHRQVESRTCLDCVETNECIVCKKTKTKTDFTEQEWTNVRVATAVSRYRQGKCRECMTRNKETKQCKGCGIEKREEDYTEAAWKDWRAEDDARGRCKKCMTRNKEIKECKGCAKEQREEAYTPVE